MDDILSGLFSLEMPLGFPSDLAKGVPRVAVRRFLLLQYHGALERVPAFSFYLYDAAQRAAVNTAVGTVANATGGSFAKFQAAVSSPSFDVDLKFATENPDSDEAKAFVKALAPTIRAAAPMIPSG